jgi:hypothetical protein
VAVGTHKMQKDLDMQRLQDKFKAPDITNLNEQLSLLGLKIHPVTADGNSSTELLQINFKEMRRHMASTSI